ncbi:hypothetical protein HK098_003359 [Nowakowskiella sp. JEL0407]|nr:hypothetical protein HK098_003359 [Nowakowskiella sp. JEL0407]
MKITRVIPLILCIYISPLSATKNLFRIARKQSAPDGTFKDLSLTPWIFSTGEELSEWVPSIVSMYTNLIIGPPSMIGNFATVNESMILYWNNTCTSRNLTNEFNRAETSTPIASLPLFIIANFNTPNTTNQTNTTINAENKLCTTHQKIANIKSSLASYVHSTNSRISGLFMHGVEKNPQNGFTQFSTILLNSSTDNNVFSDTPIFMVPEFEKSDSSMWDTNILLETLRILINGTVSQSLELQTNETPFQPNPSLRSVASKVFNLTMIQITTEFNPDTPMYEPKFNFGSLVMGALVLTIAVTISIVYHYRRKREEAAGQLTLQNQELQRHEENVVLTPELLEKIKIDTFANFSVGTGEGVKLLKESVESGCSICLEVFVGSDRVRVLPGCGHVFHVGCVDDWLLKTNTVCPNCRLDCRFALGVGDVKEVFAEGDGEGIEAEECVVEVEDAVVVK